MAKVYIADKETLDNVKQDTNNIKESISNVTNNVQYIKNQFPISGGTDWSKYENVEKYNDKEIYYSSSSDNIMFEIKGKGYIRDLIIKYDFNIDIDIYIDNKKYLNIKVDSYSCGSSSKTLYGIACIGDLIEDNWYRIGKISAEYNSINFLAHPIFFKNNVMVKINGNGTKGFYFLGGIEK